MRISMPRASVCSVNDDRGYTRLAPIRDWISAALDIQRWRKVCAMDKRPLVRSRKNEM